MDWFRWYHGCITDPKFTLIARRSGQNVASVLAVWASLLERASQAEVRGSVEGFDCESFDALLGMDEGACQAIATAMTDKGMIVDGKIAKWGERQPIKEDPNAAERKRQQRERDKDKNIDMSHGSGSGHDVSHGVTPRLDKIREDKRREEKKEKKRSASASAEAVDADSLQPEKDGTKSQDPPEEFYLTKKGRELKGRELRAFNVFMKFFDYRKGKAEAADAWFDIPQKTDELINKIISAAGREAAARPQLVASGKTPKMAQGWLSGRRWEDDPPPLLQNTARVYQMPRN